MSSSVSHRGMWRWVTLAGVLAAATAVLLWGDDEEAPEAPKARAEAPAPTEAVPATGAPERPRRSVLDDVRIQKSAPAPAEPDPRPAEKSPYALQIAPEPALSGVELMAAGPSERERQGVSDKWGTGVVVTRMHPDAPAAQAGLEPGDIIVRALRENVNAPDDLRTTVGERRQTMVLVFRDGRPFTTVLQRPWEGR